MPGTSTRLSRWGRLLTILGVLQFSISITLLLIASIGRIPLPRWAGILDGFLAFSMVVTLGLLHASAKDCLERLALLASLRTATTLVPLMLVSTWIFRQSLDMNILLPGLAWRSFVVLYGLPAGLTAWMRTIHVASTGDSANRAAAGEIPRSPNT